MNEQPDQNDLEVASSQIVEGEVVKPPKLDERMPHPTTIPKVKPDTHKSHTVKPIEPVDASIIEMPEINIDPADFTVNPLHAIARQKDIDNRKHTEPLKCIDKIKADIADIENIQKLYLDQISKVSKLSWPHFQSIKREMKRLKSILEGG